MITPHSVEVFNVEENISGDVAKSTSLGLFSCRMSPSERPIKLSNDKIVMISYELLSDKDNVLLKAGQCVVYNGVQLRVETVEITVGLNGYFNHQFAQLSKSYQNLA